MLKLVIKSSITTGLLLIAIASYAQENNPLEHLEYQIGYWEDNEELKAQDGRSYKFGLKLDWFDRNKRVIKMHITGIFDDGEVRTFWEGFKHWDVLENKMIYNGYSPDGRIAYGYMDLEEGKITTHFSSNTPKGKVLIRDEAVKIDENNFETTTFVKMPGESDWKIVNEDLWTRVN